MMPSLCFVLMLIIGPHALVFLIMDAVQRTLDLKLLEQS